MPKPVSATIELKAKSESNSIQTSTNEPELTFTAVDIGREVGVSDTHFRSNWFPLLEEIYWWRKEDLKDSAGKRYTKFCLDVTYLLQADIAAKVPIRNEDGIILRDESGKPLMMTNEPIGIEAHKQKIWNHYNRHPEKRVDAPTQPVTVEVCDEETGDRRDEALGKTEELGNAINAPGGFLNVCDQIGVVLGREIGTRIWGSAVQEANEVITEGMANLGKSVDPRKRRRSSTSQNG